MLVVLVGIAGAFVYGTADFIGGIAAKRISALRVTAIGGVSGLALLLLAYPLVGGTFSAQAVVLGSLSGIAGAAAIALLYACLAIGPMSILSPLTALVSAIVPVTAGALGGERFSPISYLAIALALVAVVLIGFVPDRRAVRPSGRALLMAVGAGALIGVFLIVINLTPDDSRLVPLIANRTTNAVLLFSAIGVLALRGRARRSRPELPAVRAGWRPGLALAIGAGIADVTANGLILFGLRLGELSVMSVLSAMYPAGTVILAAFVLKERITPTQLVGLVLAIAAAALLAIA